MNGGISFLLKVLWGMLALLLFSTVYLSRVQKEKIDNSIPSLSTSSVDTHIKEKVY